VCETLTYAAALNESDHDEIVRGPLVESSSRHGGGVFRITHLGRRVLERLEEQGAARQAAGDNCIGAKPATPAGPGVPPARTAKPDIPSTYTVAAVREMTRLSNTALNRYTRRAKVATPGRGKRNHRYSIEDVRKILQTIIDSSSERKLLSECRKALQNLQEITK
jgi:hypothetical protein